MSLPPGSILLLPILILAVAPIVVLLLGKIGVLKHIGIRQITALLSVFPAVAFISSLVIARNIESSGAIQLVIPWIPTLNASIIFYLDNLGALFALLVTGIGTLVVVYTGYYFDDNDSYSRFILYLFLFMVAMVGVFFAGDFLTLFIFWEATSITSYLLIAFKYKSEDARQSALKSLLITGGGGIALLIGIVLVGTITNTFSIPELLQNSTFLRESPFYPAIFILFAIGACTKSAQFPAHIWLPGAMTAPTPASAYLHSATMVNGGIYLMARLNPVLGNTDLWFWVLSGVGIFTMIIGAYQGFRQDDLKALLAFSTISQLGALMMLAGQDTDIAFKALVIGVLAHALYKSALFLIVGFVDHETGTRDINHLGGLRKNMPKTFLVAVVAALSMAGLPPLFGFLAKETLLATATHPTVPAIMETLLPAAAVFAGSFLFAQAFLFIFATFLGKPHRQGYTAADPPIWAIITPAIPAVISLLLGILPEPQVLAEFLAGAASNAYGSTVKVSLALWTGLNVPLVLSGIAIGIGIVLFYYRDEVRSWLKTRKNRFNWNMVYERFLRLVDMCAHKAIQLQQGKLRTYLVIILIIIIGLTIIFTASDTTALNAISTQGEIEPSNTMVTNNILVWLRIFALMLAVLSAAGSVFLRRDIHAIFALGAMGLSVALLFVLEPAPDVALVQIVVDILAVIILTLALSRIPRRQRIQAFEFTFRQSRAGLLRDAFVAILIGAIVSVVTWAAIISRPRESVISPYFEANAKALTNAIDIVGSIVVDFRAFDTVIEITVFSLAGLGIYTLLQFAAKTAGDIGEQLSEQTHHQQPSETLGVGGLRTSPFINVLANVSLPLSMIIAFVHVIYGHDQPGDGFTAGVIISLAIGFWYIVYGYRETRRRLFWLKPPLLVFTGILLAVGTGLASYFVNGEFLSPLDIGAMIGDFLPAGFYFSTSFLFEVAICLTVLGSVTYMLNTLGHPGLISNETQQALIDLDKNFQGEFETTGDGKIHESL